MKAKPDFREYLSEALGRLNSDGEISIAIKDSEGFRTKYISLPNVYTEDLLDALLYAYDSKFIGDTYE